MFLVFNKEKITSYIILLSTVLILFGVSANFVDTNTVETSANIEYFNEISNCVNEL